MELINNINYAKLDFDEGVLGWIVGVSIILKHSIGA